MSSVRRSAVVELAPDEAFELWTDVSRWPTFIDGFGHPERVDPQWPEKGAKLVWRSPPAGRGTVTERVLTSNPGARFATQVLEERLIGTQTAVFEPAPEGGTAVGLELDYQLQQAGPLKAVVDALFIRRAQSEALLRTLQRFKREAAEQAAL
jgi:uncharacterized membrane protein